MASFLAQNILLLDGELGPDQAPLSDYAASGASLLLATVKSALSAAKIALSAVFGLQLSTESSNSMCSLAPSSSDVWNLVTKTLTIPSLTFVFVLGGLLAKWLRVGRLKSQAILFEGLSDTEQYCTALAKLCLLVYQSIAEVALKLSYCVSVRDHGYRMFISASVECDSWIYPVACTLLFVPIFSLWLIEYHSSKDTANTSYWKRVILQSANAPYRTNLRYCGSATLLSRYLLVLIVQFGNMLLKSVSAVGLALTIGIITTIFARVRPFEANAANLLGCLGLVTLLYQACRLIIFNTIIVTADDFNPEVYSSSEFQTANFVLAVVNEGFYLSVFIVLGSILIWHKRTLIAKVLGVIAGMMCAAAFWVFTTGSCTLFLFATFVWTGLCLLGTLPLFIVCVLAKIATAIRSTAVKVWGKCVGFSSWKREPEPMQVPLQLTRDSKSKPRSSI